MEMAHKPGDFYANGANNQDSSQLLTRLQFKNKNCNFSFAAHVSVPSQYLFAAFGGLRLGLRGTLGKMLPQRFWLFSAHVLCKSFWSWHQINWPATLPNGCFFQSYSLLSLLSVLVFSRKQGGNEGKFCLRDSVTRASFLSSNSDASLTVVRANLSIHCSFPPFHCWKEPWAPWAPNLAPCAVAQPESKCQIQIGT